MVACGRSSQEVVVRIRCLVMILGLFACTSEGAKLSVGGTQADTGTGTDTGTDTGVSEGMSCWVIMGDHANTYCFEPVDVWPSPGFETQCRKGATYLGFVADYCPSVDVIALCHIPDGTGGDYLGAATGYYYKGDPFPESGCTSAGGTFEDLSKK